MRRTPKDTEDSARKVRRRAVLMGGAMGAFVAVLGARMRYLSVEQADEFRLLAEENRVNIRLIPPARGLILDRNGKLIAGNEQNYRVVITREDAGDVPQVLNRLASIVPLTPEDIEKTLKEVERRSPFVPITVASIFVAVSLPAIYSAQMKLVVESSQIPGNLAQSTVDTPAREQLQLFETRLMTRDNLLSIANQLRPLRIVRIAILPIRCRKD